MSMQKDHGPALVSHVQCLAVSRPIGRSGLLAASFIKSARNTEIQRRRTFHNRWCRSTKRSTMWLYVALLWSAAAAKKGSPSSACTCSGS